MADNQKSRAFGLTIREAMARAGIPAQLIADDPDHDPFTDPEVRDTMRSFIGSLWRACQQSGGDRRTTRLIINTHHPVDYVLINEADGTRFRGTTAGKWTRIASPGEHDEGDGP